MWIRVLGATEVDVNFNGNVGRTPTDDYCTGWRLAELSDAGCTILAGLRSAIAFR